MKRHRIKLPIVGWIRGQDFGDIPAGQGTVGAVVQKADRFFARVTVNTAPSMGPESPEGRGLGVDLGIKTLTVRDGQTLPNINQPSKIKTLERRWRLAQRAWSRKPGHRTRSEIPAGRGRHLAQNLWHIHNVATAIRQSTGRLSRSRDPDVGENPANLVLPREFCNVRGNRHLRKAIKGQGFSRFPRAGLASGRKAAIEAREVDPSYPSRKNWIPLRAQENSFNLETFTPRRS